MRQNTASAPACRWPCAALLAFAVATGGLPARAADPAPAAAADPADAADADGGPAPAAARAAAGVPLARFVVADGAPAELGPLLVRVADTVRSIRRIDADDEERLLLRLRDSAVDVLATEGFFSPSIGAEVDAGGQARYVLRVDPGPRTRVAAVELKLQGAVERQPGRVDALIQDWELPAGQPFRDPQWSTAKTRLLARVQERDFPTARIVDSGAAVDADDASARLHLTIDSGPAVTLGPIHLTADSNTRYERKLIERFNDIRPGDRYDAARLLELQRRLQNSPYFKNVVVDVPVDPAQPDNVPIELTLVDAQTKRVSTGIGYSTNSGPRLETVYRQVGLFGHPYTLQTGFGVDRQRTIGYADILLPPKPNGALDSFGVLGERTDIQNLLTHRWAAGVTRATTEDDLDDRRGHSYDTRISLKLQRETTETKGDPTSEFTNDTLTLSYSWTRRTVDSITNPTRGDVLTLVAAGGVSRAGLSDLLAQSFLYGYGRYVRYFPVFGEHQLILRGELGHVVVDDLRYVPLDFRFRTGGSGSVRGYAYQSLGTKDGAAVVGADSLAVFSAEYVHWLTPDWGGALFYDVGDADDRLWKIHWARGYGAGLRWRTPAGPLAFDVAYGERDHHWRLHFTIAVAF